MTARQIKIALMLAFAALLPVYSCAAADQLLVAGQQPPAPQALWLSSVEQAATSIYLLKNDLWSLVSQSSGQAAAACTVDESLHVFYAGRGYRIYQGPDESGSFDDLPGPLWPANIGGDTVLAACPAPAALSRQTWPKVPEPAETQQESTGAAATSSQPSTRPAAIQLCILLGPPSSGGAGASASAATSSKPATAGAESSPVSTSQAAAGTPSSPGPRDLVLLGLADWRWYILPTPPAQMLPPMGEIHLAPMPAGLCMVTTTHQGQPTGLAVLEEGQWQMLSLPPWRTSDGAIGGLTAVGADLFLWGTQDPNRSCVLPPPGYFRGWRGFAARASPRAVGAGAAVADRRKSIAGLQPVRRVAGGRLGQRRQLERRLHRYLDGPRAGAAVGPGQYGPVPQASGVVHVGPGGAGALLVLALIARQRAEQAKPFVLPAGAIPSPWPKRVLAFLVEYLPICAVVTTLSGYGNMDEAQLRSMINAMWRGNQNVGPLFQLALICIGVYVAYAILMEKIFGATLAKLILRMRVVTDQGRSPNLAQIILRNVTKPIELFTYPPMALVFLLWPVFSRWRRRVGDIIAGTAVIETTMRPALVGPPEIPHGDETSESSTSEHSRHSSSSEESQAAPHNGHKD